MLRVHDPRDPAVTPLLPLVTPSSSHVPGVCLACPWTHERAMTMQPDGDPVQTLPHTYRDSCVLCVWRVLGVCDFARPRLDPHDPVMTPVNPP